MPVLPKPSDFPSTLTLTITPPPTATPPVNILILLHGLGDTNTPFTALSRSLNLPETACISLQAPSPLPAFFTGSDAPSFHWGDDVLFDERTGELDFDAGFEKSVKVLTEDVAEAVLVKKCGFAKRNILLYGFGQGGMVALAAVSKSSKDEYGGVVSVGGRLPASLSSASSQDGKARTPVLVLGGSRSKQITRSAVDGLKERFSDVEYVKWDKSDDGMPRSREEMLPVMKFWAKRLRSRAGVPEGAVEV